MTHISRSRRLALNLALNLALLLPCAALVSCKSPPKENTPPTATSISAAAAPSSPSSPGSSGEAKPLKVAFAYVGPVGDAGWTFAHDSARKAASAAAKGKVESSFVENVPEAADAERVLRDMAEQGNQLIFGTTFGYMEPMLKVAKDYKDVRFEHATGYKTAPNMRTYDSKTYEGAYMAGVIAGAMTKTKTLGVVASIPIPEVIRNINSFTLGAQRHTPDVKTKVVWVNKWFDPPKEGEAAQALLNQSADVLMQNTDSSAVLQTAEKAGKFGFGWDSDMSKFGPKAHLGSAVIHWTPYYTKAMNDVLAGTWSTSQAWWGVKEGAIDLISIAEQVPAEVKAEVATVKTGLKDESFAVWKGPIVDQSGKEVLKAGEVATPEFLLGMNFYVKGVQGQIPSGK